MSTEPGEIKRLIDEVEAAVQTLADTYGEDLHLHIEGYGLTVNRPIDAVRKHEVEVWPEDAPPTFCARCGEPLEEGVKVITVEQDTFHVGCLAEMRGAEHRAERV